MYKKIIVIGCLVLSSLAFIAAKIDDRLFEIAKNLDIFATMYRELNANYVDEISPTQMMNSCIKAMLKDFDPYTVFYDEDMIEEYREMNTGAYNGIGATLENLDGKHIVTMLFEDSPADKTGIKIGDEIVKINGVEVSNKSAEEFGRLLKGQTGTNVKLQIKRYALAKPLEISVTRDIVKTQNVPHYGMIDNEVGYLLLTDFMSKNAAKEVKEAVLNMKDKGMKKLILDLRGNPGGLVVMAIDICNLFIPAGKLVVETKGKVKEANAKYLTKEQAIDTEMPIAVLINGKSASASEIVSGTIQDYDRGVIVGKKSFGKGLVQNTLPLSYNTQLKVTIAKYYIPSGRCIQAIDYGHKLADGSHVALPDSLRGVFHTKNGRIIYDGGGIEPDIKVSSAEINAFTDALIKERKIFDFATKYYYEHQNAKPEQNFSLPPNTPNDFENWFSNQNFKFKTDEQKALLDLIASSKKSGEYAEMKPQLENLQKLLDANTSKILKKSWPEIKEQLELEILSRYYYQKAMKFASFDKDNYVQTALKVLNDPIKYKATLSK